MGFSWSGLVRNRVGFSIGRSRSFRVCSRFFGVGRMLVMTFQS